MRIAICDADVNLSRSLEEVLERCPFAEAVDCYQRDLAIDKEVWDIYDVLILDCEWGQGGIGIAERLFQSNYPAEIILISSHIEDFVDTLYLRETNVAAIMNKPLKIPVLLQHLKRIADKHVDRELLLFKENGRKMSMLQKNICYVEGNDHYMDIHTGDECFHVPGTLSAIGKKLNNCFVRCHKGFLVNLTHIQVMNSKKILLKNGQEIPIGRKYLPDVREAYDRYLKSHVLEEEKK